MLVLELVPKLAFPPRLALKVGNIFSREEMQNVVALQAHTLSNVVKMALWLVVWEGAGRSFLTVACSD